MSVGGRGQGERTRLGTMNGLSWAFDGVIQGISTQTTRNERAETAKEIRECSQHKMIVVINSVWKDRDVWESSEFSFCGSHPFKIILTRRSMKEDTMYSFLYANPEVP